MNKTGYEHLPANFSVNMYFHFKYLLGIELLSHGVKCLFTLTENCSLVAVQFQVLTSKKFHFLNNH